MTKQTFNIGDRVRCIHGAIAGQVGEIVEINHPAASASYAAVRFDAPNSLHGFIDRDVLLFDLIPYRGVPASFDIDAGPYAFANQVKRQDARRKALETATQAALAQVGAL